MEGEEPGVVDIGRRMPYFLGVGIMLGVVLPLLLGLTRRGWRELEGKLIVTLVPYMFGLEEEMVRAPFSPLNPLGGNVGVVFCLDIALGDLGVG